jgi:pimeloyl-ACP methyl ester carboxylesterase
MIRISLLLIFYSLIIFGCKPYQLYDKSLSRTLKRNHFEEKYATNQISTIHYFSSRINPKKETIVLLHGFGADAKIQWTKTAKVLSKRCNVIFIDLAFHGKTETSITDYSFDFQAKIIKEVLEKENIQTKINILGNSYGAMVASTFAENYPDCVHKLILNDALTFLYSTKTSDSIADSFKVKSLYNLLNPLNIEDLKKTKKVVFYRKFPLPKYIANSIITEYFLPKKNKGLELFNYLNKNEKQLSKIPKLNPNATFYIWGSNDPLIPLYIGKKHKQILNIPDENWFEITQTAHVPNLERNRKFCKTVFKILER